MSFIKGLIRLGLVALIFLPLPALAGVPDKSECDTIDVPDRRNLCLAQLSHQGEGDPLDKNRYQDKDHSSYYCSLVRSRDLKNMCQAVIEKNKGKCDLIGNKEIEQECLEAIK